MLSLYLKGVAVLLFFLLQFIFVLPYYMSSSEWWEFTLGWFIVLVVDPIVIFKLWKDAISPVEKLFEDVK